MEKVVPLSGGFLLIAIIGFILSWFLVYNKGLHSLGFAFMLVFMAMFIASFISLNKMEADTIKSLDRRLKEPKR